MRLFLLIFGLAGLAQFFLPWWIITPVALAAGAALGRTGGRAFLAGFAGIGLGWLLVAGWEQAQNAGRLSHRVAQLIPLGGSGWALVVVTAIIGGLVGGLAALAGCWLRQAVLTPRQAPAAKPDQVLTH
ncbi:hypothetical protein [Hymenobacter persicinus]|uniref:Uncharacterized protein n=1 Tax=Hymenobacter persicinus TaxID=2025506 RepID=A0A4Q5LE04_9BACT|nr:hypothetical protein [Hymenobacter persicinus]RYU80125.1 hypothetical protein EWM57_09290 [Hymenobacter persicinus]